MNIEALAGDIRHALRVFRRRPLLTAVILLSLALGIGANSAIFTVAHANLFEQPPYQDPEQILHLWETFPVSGREGYGSVSVPNLVDWRERSETIAVMAGYLNASFNLLQSGAEQAERIAGLSAEPELLELLGVAPVVGRVFESGETNVVVLSHQLWTERFAAKSDVVGSTIRLNETPFQIVGVMPADFEFPMGRRTQLFTPMVFTESQKQDRGTHWLRVLARLSPGVTRNLAATELQDIAEQIALEHPDVQEGRGARVASLMEPIVRDSKAAIFMLIGAVALVLLITCANVTNLLLAQASQRRKEVQIRAALGADRMQLARQMLVETQLLSLFGAFLGAVIGSLILRGLSSLSGSAVRVSEDLAMDPRVLFFSIVAGVLTTFLCGCVPAVRWSQPASSHGASLATRGEAKDRLRSSLVVAEVALAVIVLVTAGLTVRSLIELGKVDSGMDQENLMKFVVSVGSDRYQEGNELANYWRRVNEELGAKPSIESVGLISHLPLLEWGTNGNFQVVGAPTPEVGTEPFAEYRAASSSYFGTVGIPVLEGRIFPTGLDPDGQGRVVVNEALANKYFPASDAVGSYLTNADDPLDQESWSLITGVVGNVRMMGLDRDVAPTVYYSTEQWQVSALNVVLRPRTTGEAAVLEARAALASIDPNQAPFSISSFEEVVLGANARRRFNAQLLSGFGLLAISLALAGAAGVLWYTASLRRKEIAIRMALGANRNSIVRAFLVSGTSQALLGVLLGLGCSAIVVRLVESQLFGVSALDPITYLIVGASIFIASALASYVPAARAARSAPALLLRD